MFERLNALVREQLQAVTIEELRRIATMFGEVPGVRATRDGDRVVVEGRGLGRRILNDARLRFGPRDLR